MNGKRNEAEYPKAGMPSDETARNGKGKREIRPQWECTPQRVGRSALNNSKQNKKSVGGWNTNGEENIANEVDGRQREGERNGTKGWREE